MSTLVVCFSRSGHTRQIALYLAHALAATCEEIIDQQSYKGISGFLRGGHSALRHKTTTIKPIQQSPAKFERTIICTPVWAGSIPPAMRTFIQQYTGKITKTAFVVCCANPSNGQKVVTELATLVGQPQASVIIADKELKSPDYKNKLATFINELNV